MTHDFDEVPDKYSIGRLHTGHHWYLQSDNLAETRIHVVYSVNITVTSITPYLPSSIEYENEAFGGTVAHARMTPLQEVNLSKKQAEMLIEDSNKRNVVWAADEDVDVDAEGDDDPDYIRMEDGTYKPIDPTPIPIGIRGQEGTVNALPLTDNLEEAQYGGVSERVPTKLREMVGFKLRNNLFKPTGII